MYKTEEFIVKFKKYCQQQFPPNTGTATSYSNAIKYLLEFMGVAEITDNVLSKIKDIEPDIRDMESILYKELNTYFTATGRQSYLKKGFLKAALLVFTDFINTINPESNTDLILIREVKDNQITADFSPEKLKHQFPISTHTAHSYDVRRLSGTAEESAQKIKSGRRAEKYFISFLTHLGFNKNVDYFDVANNKNFGYDVRFLDFGLEIKNIKSGGFFLSDNEIARLETTSTHLILVDINNGIWLLKNSSSWLKQKIKDIKELRNYCKTKYKNLDPCDIKIFFDNSIDEDIIDISNMSKEHLINLLLN